jgi:hypothetical protein
MRLRALLVLMLASFAINCGAANTIKGSGNVVDRIEPVEDFSTVEAGSAFEVTIKRGDAFKVTISADDNILEYVRVTKKGQALKIDVQGDNLNLNNPHLKAEIVMPTLEGVRLDGASKAVVGEFKVEKPFTVDLNGASSLEGVIEANEATIRTDGASTIKLKGSANTAKLSANGASHLKLSDFTIDKAETKLDGAASAKLNVKSALSYDIDGASNLTYAGRPASVRGDKSGAASVSRG